MLFLSFVHKFRLSFQNLTGKLELLLRCEEKRLRLYKGTDTGFTSPVFLCGVQIIFQ